MDPLQKGLTSDDFYHGGAGDRSNKCKAADPYDDHVLAHFIDTTNKVLEYRNAASLKQAKERNASLEQQLQDLRDGWQSRVSKWEARLLEHGDLQELANVKARVQELSARLDGFGTLGATTTDSPSLDDIVARMDKIQHQLDELRGSQSLERSIVPAALVSDVKECRKRLRSIDQEHNTLAFNSDCSIRVVSAEACGGGVANAGRNASILEQLSAHSSRIAQLEKISGQVAPDRSCAQVGGRVRRLEN